MNDWISVKDRLPNYGIHKVKSKLWTAIAKWDDFKEEWSEINCINGACMDSEITHYIPLFTLADDQLPGE